VSGWHANAGIIPLTTAKNKRQCKHCHSLESPTMSASFILKRLFKKEAVDVPLTPVASIATG